MQDATNPMWIPASGVSIMENYEPFYLQLSCKCGEAKPVSLMLNCVTDAVALIVGKSHQHTRLVQKLLPGNNVPPRIKDVSTDQAAFSYIISLTLFFSTGKLNFPSINGLNMFHFNIPQKKTMRYLQYLPILTHNSSHMSIWTLKDIGL